MDEVLALIGRAHQGDKEARDTLVEKNTGLVHSIVKRFLNRGVEMEDLFQIGTIGLLKAIDKFDCSFDVNSSDDNRRNQALLKGSGNDKGQPFFKRD